MNTRRMIVFLIATAVLLLFLITIVVMMGSKCTLPDARSFGGRCGNRYSNVLYDFQSLIAGVLAVCAAGLTIITMNKNTRDILYSEWRTLLFKVNFHATQLQTCTRTVQELIENRVPNNLNRDDWVRYLDDIIFQVTLLRTVIVNAQNEGFSTYSLGALDHDFLKVDEAVKRLNGHRLGVQLIQPFTQAIANDCQTLLAEISNIANQVDGYSGNALNAFFINSRFVNPMRLQL